MKTKSSAPLSPRAALERSYHNSRGNLLLVVIFTVVNLLLAASGSSHFFLFSAFIPYMAMLLGLSLTGHTNSGNEALVGDRFLYACIAFAAVIILAYLLFFLFSKKHYGWLIPALVLFVLDCVVFVLFSLYAGFDFGMIVDFFFHGWILFSLIMGIVNGVKLKNMPTDTPIPAEFTEQSEQTDSVFLNGKEVKKPEDKTEK